MLMLTARCGVSSGSWGFFDTGSAARSEREPRPTEEEGQARHRVASDSVGGSVPRIQVVRFDVCGIPGLGRRMR
jgi:hypothetical protein